MKIPAPKILPQLELADDLEHRISLAREQERDIMQCLFRGVTLQNTDVGRIGFVKTVFETCKFHDCDFERTEWIDVCFRDCDLSGCHFSDSYFKRCSFKNCKGVGAELTGTTWQDIVCEGCNFSYSNFSGSRWSTVSLEECDWSCSSLAQCQFGKIEVKDAVFIGTNFFQTPLTGIDFTSCQLEEIMASGEEFRGATVNAYQAAQLAKLWGVIVK